MCVIHRPIIAVQWLASMTNANGKKIRSSYFWCAGKSSPSFCWNITDGISNDALDSLNWSTSITESSGISFNWLLYPSSLTISAKSMKMDMFFCLLYAVLLKIMITPSEYGCNLPQYNHGSHTFYAENKKTRNLLINLLCASGIKATNVECFLMFLRISNWSSHFFLGYFVFTFVSY